MKQTIEVRDKRHKNKSTGVQINRIIEQGGQYIGPMFCRYKGKKVEVFSDNTKQFGRLGEFFILA
jgi:hypothetical protein